MKDHVRWETIEVEYLGLFDLALPVGLIGTGRAPIISLTALIHGDETTGLLALHKLIEEHVPSFRFHGSIRVIPVANPLAALTRTRASYLDMLDMNRRGIGDPDGQLTERVSHALYELVKDSEMVINLHEFEADSPLLCVYTNAGSHDVRGRILKGMLAFSPELVWSIPFPDDEAPRPLLSFDSMVASSGTPAFSIEFPRGDLVGPDTLDNFLMNLCYLFSFLGVIEDGVERPKTYGYTKAVRRTPVYSQKMGIWNPRVDLMSEVDEDEVVGTLYALPDFSELDMKSPSHGIVMQMRPLEVVHANSIVYAVGTADQELENEFESLLSAKPRT